MIYAALVLFATLLAVGQVLFKKTSLNVAASQGSSFLLALPKDYYFWSALCCYAVATVLWIWILQHVPLSRAYAFNALGFIIVPLLGHLVFGEIITMHMVLGSLLIIIGMFLIVPS